MTRLVKAQTVRPEPAVQAFGFNGIGLTSDYNAFRQTYWGQPQPVNYELLWRMYREDPVIAGVISIQVNDIIGDGWDLVEGSAVEFAGQDVQGVSAKENAQHIRDVFDKSNWSSALRDIITQYLVYGDAYVEMVRNNPSQRQGYAASQSDSQSTNGKQLPQPKAASFGGGKGLSFDVDYDSKGVIIPDSMSETLFKEIAGLKLDKANTAESLAQALKAFERRIDAASTPKGSVDGFIARDAKTFRIDYDEHGNVIKYIQRVLHRRVDFRPQELVHFANNQVGNRPYGMSALGSLLYTFQAKQSAENYSYDYFRRGAIPRLVYVAKNFSKEQVDRLVANLKSLQPQQDIVVFGDVDPKMVAPTNQDMQFSDLLGYLKQNIYIATQVPPVLAGDAAMGATAGRNTSQVQLDMYYKRIKSLKKDIADAINRKLLSPENFGVHNVRFVFLEDNTKEELRRLQAAQLKGTVQWVTPNQVLDEAHLPHLEGEWEEQGNTPIFFIQQQQQEKMMEQQAALAPKPGQPGGKKPSPGSINKPGQANPTRSVTHADNAEENNASQQSDTKKGFGDFGYQHEMIAGHEDQAQDVSVRTRVGPDNLANPNAIPERQLDGFGAIIPAKPNLADADRYLELRDLQNTEIIENPVQNAMSLNSDRVWPKGDKFELQDVDAPVFDKETGKIVIRRRKPAGNTIVERNPELAGPFRNSLKPTEATFYKGTNQMEELGLDKPKKAKGSAKKQD